MSSILITLSPSNALQMLNGKPIVLPFKVPIGTAYVYVGKGKPYLCDYRATSMTETKFLTQTILLGEMPMNGLVVAKCEIAAVKWWGTDWSRKVSRPLYCATFTALTVFDKPMELKEFRGVMTASKKSVWNGARYTLNRAPSRWQAVEVGK